MTLRTNRKNTKEHSVSMISILAKPDVKAIRTQKFAGEEHTVVPVVMLVEGVLWPANSDVPELALAEEFGKFPESWDGRPVVLNHPKRGGKPVSANSPDILERYAVGQLFNTKLDGKKLKSEMWINNSRVKELGEEAEKELERLQSDEDIVEVSTGLFTMVEMTSGSYDGQEFQGIWRDIAPDHLAILPEGLVGACSVADGCGAPRLNASKKGQKLEDVNAIRMEVDPIVVNTECGCEDKSNCQCGQVIQNTSPAILQSLKRAFKSLFFRENQELVLSDDDVRTAVSTALRSSGQGFFWIVAVFRGADNSGSFVYEDFDDFRLYAQNFSIKNDGTVVLSGDRVEVRPETRFVPVKVETGGGLSDQSSGTQQEVGNMNKEELVKQLIDSEGTQLTADDQSWLMNLEESQLQKLLPQAKSETTEEVDEPGDPQAAAASAPATLEGYIAQAPAEIQEVLQSGIKMHQARKAKLVKSLLENARNKFSKQYLEQQSLETLENLAALADVKPDYTGAGAVRTQSTNDNVIDPPEELFPVKQAS